MMTIEISTVDGIRFLGDENIRLRVQIERLMLALEEAIDTLNATTKMIETLDFGE